ncbi:MAG TPA: C25 family cysteine peptidase [Pyrinomonadaceae bacterium]|nr:C25 family cysteine peptidase [Pyrinomonadaceae bacterium]
MHIFRRRSGGLRRAIALLLSLAVAGLTAFPGAASSAFASHSSQQKDRWSRYTRIFSTSAIAFNQGVFVRWITSFELDNVGFNIYRVGSAGRLKLNREIIGGSVFIVGQNVPLRAGYSYSFFDRKGVADSVYLVEAVGLDGSITSSAQVTSQSKAQFPFDFEIASSGTAAERMTEDQKAYPSGNSESPTPEYQVEDQWAIVSQPGLKISVKKDGWYRVTQQQMVAAGFSPAVDIENLRLFNNARELAIYTNRTRGPFVSGDYIEFYGQGLDTPSTDTNIYYLLAGTTEGKRIVTAGKRTRDDVRPEDASPGTIPNVKSLPELYLNSRTWFWWLPAIPLDSGARRTIERKSESTTTLARPARKKQPRKRKKKSRRKRQYAHKPANLPVAQASSFDYTVEKKDRSVYFVSLLNGNVENFFGQVINNVPVVQTLATRNPEVNASIPARLEIALQGASQANHVITVELNEVTLGTLSFFGLDRKVQTFEVPISQLSNGDNSIKLTPAAGSGLTLVDYTRLHYAHSYRADNNSLRFTTGPAQSSRVDGFTTSSIRVIDYSDPFAVRMVKPLVELNADSYTIQLASGQSQSASRRFLYAFPEGEADQSAVLSLNDPSSLNSSTNQADLLVIAHKSLLPSLSPLAVLRTSQGLAVSVVDVEDVYDEFSYGLHGPQAIKDFVAFASTRWSRGPQYVIFAGDASYDPRNYLGLGNRDFVPTKLVDATFNETSSDDWLTDFNDDGIADIPVGRLPAATASQANVIISKLINFSPSNVPQSALLVADAQRNYYFNFEQANTEVQGLLPPSMVVERVDRRTEPSDTQASINIVSKINSGQALVNYSGHGNVNTWTDGSIFSSDIAMSLTNGNKLPFVVVMDCLNGYFHEPRPGFSGLAEAFLQAPNGGAVASFASSGLTLPDGQHAMSTQLYKLLYGSQSIALGDAIKIAKASTNDIDVRRTWIFFGDPSLKIR